MLVIESIYKNGWQIYGAAIPFQAKDINLQGVLPLNILFGDYEVLCRNTENGALGFVQGYDLYMSYINNNIEGLYTDSDLARKTTWKNNYFYLIPNNRFEDNMKACLSIGYVSAISVGHPASLNSFYANSIYDVEKIFFKHNIIIYKDNIGNLIPYRLELAIVLQMNGTFLNLYNNNWQSFCIKDKRNNLYTWYVTNEKQLKFELAKNSFRI